MRRLIAYTLSVACLAWAASACAEGVAKSGQPITKILGADDGSSLQGRGSEGNPSSGSGSGSAQGHGKIDSPRGSMAAAPQASGKTDIQFNCSAAGATISGSTHFRFKSGDLDFRATSHDRLVFRGGNVEIGGAGTVNGAAGYRFTLSAFHGASDLLRMRITSQATGAVVYDSQMGQSETAPPSSVISGGWIDITAPALAANQKAVHARETSAAPALSSAPLGFELAQNFPNPFRATTQVRFTLPERSHLKLMVLDVAGRRIATLALGPWDAGSHVVSWSGRTEADQPARSGIYFVRMTAGLADGEQRFISLRKMILVD